MGAVVGFTVLLRKIVVNSEGALSNFFSERVCPTERSFKFGNLWSRIGKCAVDFVFKLEEKKTNSKNSLF